MSTPVLGRNARLLKAGQPICYCKNISVKASAEMIKDYSMGALTPAVEERMRLLVLGFSFFFFAEILRPLQLAGVSSKAQCALLTFS